jgi:hypothetical protein
MNEFQNVFQSLKAILQKYQTELVLIHDQPDRYYLNLHHTREDGYQIYFGSVQIKKNYVSYYLMAIYTYPELLENISAPLKKRMQGKSCFNFKKLEPDLEQELENLTKLCFEKFKAVGMI